METRAIVVPRRTGGRRVGRVDIVQGAPLKVCERAVRRPVGFHVDRAGVETPVGASKANVSVAFLYRPHLVWWSTPVALAATSGKQVRARKSTTLTSQREASRRTRCCLGRVGCSRLFPSPLSSQRDRPKCRWAFNSPQTPVITTCRVES